MQGTIYDIHSIIAKALSITTKTVLRPHPCIMRPFLRQTTQVRTTLKGHGTPTHLLMVHIQGPQPTMAKCHHQRDNVPTCTTDRMFSLTLGSHHCRVGHLTTGNLLGGQNTISQKSDLTRVLHLHEDRRSKLIRTMIDQSQHLMKGILKLWILNHLLCPLLHLRESWSLNRVTQ